MGDWKEVELGTLAEIKGGKRLPKGSILTEIPNSHPYIRTRDINNNSIAINELLFVPDEIFPAISRYIVEKNDVIISIVGTIGLCSIIPKELHFASLTENCAKIVNVKENILDKEYLFYYLISKDGQTEIESRNVGSTQPKLPLYNIKGIPVPIPPLPEQKAIASVLSSLDDKIDLLHRQNKTLEAMAEILFRQWFVEEAQEDWEEVPLGAIATVQNGYTFMKDSMGILGHPAMIDKSDTYVLNQRVARIYLNSNESLINNHFLYLQLKTDVAIAIIQSKAHGGVQVNLSTEAIRSTPIIVPPEPDQEKGFKLLEGYLLKSQNNRKQIRTLERLRDTLLPKLMSGEVRVQYNKETTA